MPRQSQTQNSSNRKKKHYSSVVKRKQPGKLTRLLQKIPTWAWWIGGLIVAAGYVWAFYVMFVSPYGSKWRAINGVIKYPKGYEIHGIDVSHYQGEIDWKELYNKGRIDGYPIRFVMIKATEGATNTDDTFQDNFHNARENGFTRGAYHFFGVKSSAEDQARHFIKTVKLEPGDLPPVLDVEHKPKHLTDEQFKNSVLKWLQIVEKHYGVKPIIYTYYKFKTRYLSDKVFDSYPYWIAHYYVEEVEYEGKWKFWQYTDVGKLPGIEGEVDFDIYNGSFYDLRQMTINSQEQIGEKAYSN